MIEQAVGFRPALVEPFGEPRNLVGFGLERFLTTLCGRELLGGRAERLPKLCDLLLASRDRLLEGLTILATGFLDLRQATLVFEPLLRELDLEVRFLFEPPSAKGVRLLLKRALGVESGGACLRECLLERRARGGLLREPGLDIRMTIGGVGE